MQGRAALGPVSRPRGLYERDQELAVVRRSLQAARQEAGGMLLVEGPAGIGKTRQLEEILRQARALGFLVGSARAGELEQDNAFGVEEMGTDSLRFGAVRGQNLGPALRSS